MTKFVLVCNIACKLSSGEKTIFGVFPVDALVFSLSFCCPGPGAGAGAGVVCGLWSVVCGLWSVVCGLWSVVCGLWSVVCGLWSVVCGLWSFHRLTHPRNSHLTIKQECYQLSIFINQWHTNQQSRPRVLSYDSMLVYSPRAHA